MNAPTLLWIRLDLRLADNPAMQAALQRGGPIIPVYIWAPEEESPWAPGSASRWWLHQSLKSLDSAYRKLGSRLIIRRGPTLEALRLLIKETGADAVFWNRRYEPAVLTRDLKIKTHLRDLSIETESFNASLLHEPWTIKNKAGKPFQVFTPFWKHCLATTTSVQPLPTPDRIPAPAKWPTSLTLAALELEPKINWAGGIREAWQPGESGARENLTQFLQFSFGEYKTLRDRPDLLGTSRLSPHLHFGEISPRQVWAAAPTNLEEIRHSQYFAELGWREFSHHLLFHFPNTPEEPLQHPFSKFRWEKNPSALRAWQKGLTGYPIVDAGMRQLWATGWMHNRVRMIVASFLVKDLLLPWTEGTRWFWDTLVDADLAQNTLGWQWTSGCGADPAPFFRVFNPVTQGEKFDPAGAYVSRWCPELNKIPDRWIHQPWCAPPEVLRSAGVQLGTTYPTPIVDHSQAREIALERYRQLRSNAL